MTALVIGGGVIVIASLWYLFFLVLPDVAADVVRLSR